MKVFEGGIAQDHNKIYSILLSHDDKYLLASDDGGFLRQWDTAMLTLVHNYGRIHTGVIKTIILHNNLPLIYTTCNNGGLQCHNIETKQLFIDKGNVHHAGILAICITKDGKSLFTSGLEGSINQWNVKTNKFPLIKTYQKLHKKGCIIKSILTTNDSKY